MTTVEIESIQAEIGTPVDGFWGPLSIAACQSYLRSLMPRPNLWPDSDFSSLRSFYGEPGDESNLVSLILPHEIFFEGRPVGSIRCHRKVSASLDRALNAAILAAPNVATIYDGCFNARRMRGGSSWSLHAWGAAIDLDAEHNGNHDHWPTKATMPFSVMKAFAREGWLPAGAFWGRDAMHFQATQ